MESQKRGRSGMNEQIKSPYKICGRLCVEMTGYLTSPLAVGSGEQEYTDSDVVFNAQGEPYIPGTSLAGAMRQYADAIRGMDETNRLFGMPENGVPGSREDRQSRIFIYDAVMKKGKTGVRDGIKLNENKTTSPMGKYELQFVERDAEVTFRIEFIEREECFEESKSIQEIWEDDLKWIKLWQTGFNRGELRLGSKSRRGYGNIKIDQVKMKKFDMRDKSSFLEWLDWDWGQKNTFENLIWSEIYTQGMQVKDESRLERCMEVPLHISSTLLVRTYSVPVVGMENIPDYEQMTAEGKGEQAIIPGSSWAGAFRSHIAKIVKELGQLESWNEAQKKLNLFFGTWTDTNEKNQNLTASRIIFEETMVEGGHGLPTARIAIDRFTGGTVQGALYEEVPWTGGNLCLRIRWKKSDEKQFDKVICGMLLWAIKDLQSGFLAVGGETSVGRGIFEPDKEHSYIFLDKKMLDEKTQKELMQAAAAWVRTLGKEKNRGGQEYGKV